MRFIAPVHSLVSKSYFRKIFNLNFVNFSSKHYSSTMIKPKVYVTREVNKEAIEILEKQCVVSIWEGDCPVPRSELLKNIPGISGLFCMLTDTIDTEVLETAGPSLKVIATMSVGYEHLQIDEIKKRNIKVGYTPDVLTDATAELTIGLLLATSRRFLEANQAAKAGNWKAWSPFWMCGPQLSGTTVGIVGFGRIGQEVASKLQPFHVKQILYCNRSERSKEAANVGAKRVSFDELLRESEFVIATCALTPDTKEMFNDDAFDKMKPDAVFINTGRGGLVNQEALIRVLSNKSIRAAGLDVMTPEPLPVDSPLFKLDNCVILPHIGSAAIQTRNAMGITTAENIICALTDKHMPYELII